MNETFGRRESKGPWRISPDSHHVQPAVYINYFTKHVLDTLYGSLQSKNYTLITLLTKTLLTAQCKTTWIWKI